MDVLQQQNITTGSTVRESEAMMDTDSPKLLDMSVHAYVQFTEF